MGDDMKKKSIGKKVKEFLGEIWLGRWGRYADPYDDDDDDWTAEENDPNMRLKWKISIPEEESRGDN